jgi:hypothetical protein
MLTIGDALISVCYGTLLFDENLRLNWWLLPELLGLAAIAFGYIELSRSPLASGQTPAAAASSPGVDSDAGTDVAAVR